MSSSDPKKVLIIDDDLTVRLLIRELIENEGITAIMADGGEAALDILSRETPDLILIDRIMRPMDGIELKQKLEELPHLDQVPTFFLSGLGAEEVPGLRVTGYIPKPFDCDELVATIKQHLQ